jgi:putative hydrolase of the HAD superfamily
MHTNDLTSFHNREWIDRMTILREFDVMVEGRTDGVYKPDPEAYLLMVERMGMTPEEIVFIDDQPVNIDGAQEVGMVCVYLDPTDPDPAYARARELLGLQTG